MVKKFGIVIFFTSDEHVHWAIEVVNEEKALRRNIPVCKRYTFISEPATDLEAYLDSGLIYFAYNMA